MKRTTVLLTATAIAGLTSLNLAAQPGGSGGPGGGPGGSSSTVTLSVSATGLSNTSGTNAASGKTYTSSTADENIVQVTGGTLTLTSCTLAKTGGDTESDGDNSSFYGVNSAAYCGGTSSVLNLVGGAITTAAKGCNAVFATNGGTIVVSDLTINNTKDTSRGLHATYGGIIKASNLDITTAGTSSSTIATDRGGGTVTVDGGTYTAKGMNSAVTYSTGTITVTGITGLSEQGEIAVIEGNNSITLNNSTLTSGSSKRALMILQSGSGDSEGYNGRITVNGGSLTLTGSSTPLLEVPTNMTGTLTLHDVDLNVPSGTLMLVDYNTQWSTSGGTGHLILTTDGTHTYTGDVVADATGTTTVSVGAGVTWNGANDADNTAKATTVTIASGATWVLTADSYVDTLVNNGRIELNGHTLHAGTQSGSGTTIEGTTGIGGVTATTGTAANAVYDLNGRRLSVTSVTGLPAGIYVVGGRKVLVR